MARTVRTIALLSLILAMAGVAPQRGPVAGSQAPQQPAPRFRTGVDVVEVAVLVRDREGKPITDLTRDEITVLENGTPQALVAFEQVSLPVRRDVAPEPVVQVQVPRDVASNEPAAPSRVFVLVLGISGMITHDIVVPATRRNGLEMSGVSLTSAPSVLMITKGKPWLDQALPTPPTAARTFVAGDQIVAAVEVYRQGSAAAAATLVARVDRRDGSPSGFEDRRVIQGHWTGQRAGRFPHQYGKTARRPLRAPGHAGSVWNGAARACSAIRGRGKVIETTPNFQRPTPKGSQSNNGARISDAAGCGAFHPVLRVLSLGLGGWKLGVDGVLISSPQSD